MRNKLLAIACLFLLTPLTVHAEKILFMRDGCIYCDHLDYDLGLNNAYEEHEIKTVYVTESPENLQLYLDTAKKIGYAGGAVPLLVDGFTHIEGHQPVLDYLGYSNFATESPAVTSLSKEDSQILNDIIQQEADPEDRTQILLIFGGALILSLSSFFLYWSRRD